MPVRFHINQPDLKICLWEITETTQELEGLAISNEEEDGIRHAERNRQWLACRAAAKTIATNIDSVLYKDEFGKPHLDDGEKISLSHTMKYAAAVTSKFAVGIDIERVTPRIERIAHKFLHKSEYELLDPNHKLESLYLIWCAKEALYKLYGKKSVDFSEHMHVQKFNISTSGTFKMLFLKGSKKEFDAYYRRVDDHLVVWVIDPTS